MDNEAVFFDVISDKYVNYLMLLGSVHEKYEVWNGPYELWVRSKLARSYMGKASIYTFPLDVTSSLQWRRKRIWLLAVFSLFS